METTENLDLKEKKSSAKEVVGIRGLPMLNEALEKEAAEKGMTKSSYGEKILIDRHEGKKEVDRKNQLIRQQQEKIDWMEGQIAAKDLKQSEAVSTEITELRSIIEQQKELLAIFDDKRLLYLYDHLKGKTDKVENAYGDNFNIVYDTPYQVLLALIYSCKLEK